MSLVKTHSIMQHQKRVKMPVMSMKPLITSAMPKDTIQVSRCREGWVPAANMATSGSFMIWG